MGWLLEALVSAPRGMRRWILAAVVIGVVYPVFVVFGVLGALRLLPPAASAPAREFIVASVGLDDETRLISTVNRSNQTVDGSTPMSFQLSDKDGGDVYYQVIERGQAISFWTYQKSSPRLSSDPVCADADPLDEEMPFGDLLIRTPDRSYGKTIPVPQSLTGLARLSDGIDAKEWERLNASQPGNGPVQLIARFRPNREFLETDYFKCNSVLVSVNMTFLKPPLAGAKR